MSDSRKYYYLKLKDNFFDSDEIIVLESMADGYLYSNILLKLYLRSLKNEGRLMFNDRIPFSSTMLANVTRHSVGDIEKAINIFQELGLIEMLDNGAIYVMDIQNFIGTSSSEADRIREYRSKINKEKTELIETENEVVQMYDNRTPELELDIEKEIKKDIDKELVIKNKKVEKKETLNNKNNVHLFYQQNFGTETSFITQDLEYWIEDLSNDVVLLALQKAIEQNAPYGYAKTVMKNWANVGVKTVEQAESEMISHSKRTKKGNKYNQTAKKENIPDWVVEQDKERAAHEAGHKEVSKTISPMDIDKMMADAKRKNDELLKKRQGVE